MKTEQILICIVSLILGVLLENILKNVCGCNNVEGLFNKPIIKPSKDYTIEELKQYFPETAYPHLNKPYVRDALNFRLAHKPEEMNKIYLWYANLGAGIEKYTIDHINKMVDNKNSTLLGILMKAGLDQEIMIINKKGLTEGFGLIVSGLLSLTFTLADPVAGVFLFHAIDTEPVAVPSTATLYGTCPSSIQTLVVRDGVGLCCTRHGSCVASTPGR